MISTLLFFLQTLENNLFAFITYLQPLPILIFCDILYPRPDNRFPNSRKTTFINTFAIINLLDLAQLIFADAGCFQTYHVGWMVAFYTALAISVILQTFSYGLEQKKTHRQEPRNKDLVFTVLNLCFTDILFLVLRSYKAYRMKHAYIDAIFITKEISSLIMRLMLTVGVYCYMYWDWVFRDFFPFKGSSVIILHSIAVILLHES